MEDAVALLESTYGKVLSNEVVVLQLLCADDALLIDVSLLAVETFMLCVSKAGASCGLSLNWTKLELLCARCNGHIVLPNGHTLRGKSSMAYLGGILSADGRPEAE